MKKNIFQLLFLIFIIFYNNLSFAYMLIQKQLLADIKEELKPKISYTENELAQFNPDFKEYYNSDVKPHIEKLYNKIRVLVLDKKNAIITGDSARNSAWGLKNFFAIVENKNNKWNIVKIEIDIEGSIACDNNQNCQFDYFRFSNNPKTPNNHVKAVFSYAKYGVSGHSFINKIVTYNIMRDEYNINTVTTAVPLIADSTWYKN